MPDWISEARNFMGNRSSPRFCLKTAYYQSATHMKNAVADLNKWIFKQVLVFCTRLFLSSAIVRRKINGSCHWLLGRQIVLSTGIRNSIVLSDLSFSLKYRTHSTKSDTYCVKHSSAAGNTSGCPCSIYFASFSITITFNIQILHRARNWLRNWAHAWTLFPHTSCFGICETYRLVYNFRKHLIDHLIRPLYSRSIVPAAFRFVNHYFSLLPRANISF